MANIRVSYALTSSLVAAVSTVAISVSAAGGATVVARPENNIQISAFVVPMEYLDEQTVIASDFRTLSFGKGIVDPTDSVEPTEQIAFAPDIVLTDSVTMYDVVYKDVTEVVDYDRSDADVDPDPVTASDTSTRSVGKTLTDSATAADTVDTKTVGKVSTDTVTTSDTVNTKHVGKALTDTATASDASPVFNASKVVADSASATDAAALNVAKGGIADTVTSADSAVLQPSITKADTATAADTLNSFAVGKNPSDSVTAADSAPVFSIAQVLSDVVTITDVVYKDFSEMVDYDRNDADVDPDPVTVADTTAITFATSKSDAVTATDSPVADVQTVRADNVTASDAATKAPGKVLTDAATVSDSAVLAPGKVTTDSVTASDTAPVFAQNKTTTDTVTASDAAPVVSVAKVVADSATIVDSISLLLIPGITTPWFDVAFASDEKFTYQWTLGTINSHLVHQPLVNGEFVLTTNPNAGIVYTIRTESVEYTYNGYGLNENQLN
jgi:hypothetical protein